MFPAGRMQRGIDLFLLSGHDGVLLILSALIFVEGGGHQYTAFGGDFLAFGIIGYCAVCVEGHFNYDVRFIELDGLARYGVIHQRECPCQYRIIVVACRYIFVIDLILELSRLFADFDYPLIGFLRFIAYHPDSIQERHALFQCQIANRIQCI